MRPANKPLTVFFVGPLTVLIKYYAANKPLNIFWQYLKFVLIFKSIFR